MSYNNDYPFDIGDVAYLLQIPIPYKGNERTNYNVDCPFCGKKEKLNLNFRKNVFRCNRCIESGHMLDLYAKIYGIDTKQAYHEIVDRLHCNVPGSSYEIRRKEIKSKIANVINVPIATKEVRHYTYSTFLSMLSLTTIHRDKLLMRGLTEEQITKNEYRSTPIFGFKNLTKKIIENGCTVKGVPGFYQEENGEWNINFYAKSSGIIIPVRDTNGYIVGMQIRCDKVYKGKKYIWFSSSNKHMGVSSGSPIHFVGEKDTKILFITEGGLKGDIAHAISNNTFACVAGVNQYTTLKPFLEKFVAENKIKLIYEAYDMDKFLNTICKGDYNSDCIQCEHYSKYINEKVKDIECPRKQIKRKNIQNGCNKLKDICSELQIPLKVLIWNTDGNGNWNEEIKGIDDYLYDFIKK